MAEPGLRSRGPSGSFCPPWHRLLNKKKIVVLRRIKDKANKE
jgi:hypothetical protein